MDFQPWTSTAFLSMKQDQHQEKTWQRYPKHGPPIESPGFSHHVHLRFSVVLFSWFSMDFSIGKPCGFPRFFYESSMGFLWFSVGFLSFSVVFCGFSVGFPHFSPLFSTFLARWDRRAGPDHLAALAPLVIGKRRSIFAAFGLGALWGSGHATGQLVPWDFNGDGDGDG